MAAGAPPGPISFLPAEKRRAAFALYAFVASFRELTAVAQRYHVPAKRDA